MTHKLKTEMFSQKIEYSDGVFFWPLTPLFSFVSFHLKYIIWKFLEHNLTSETQLLAAILYRTALTEPRREKNLSSGLATRLDSNRLAQLQRLPRGLRFRI